MAFRHTLESDEPANNSLEQTPLPICEDCLTPGDYKGFLIPRFGGAFALRKSPSRLALLRLLAKSITWL